MTLTSTTTKIQYNGDGSTVSFPITFIYWLNADIKVIHKDAAGTETVWVLGTQYTLTGGEGSTGTLTVEVSPTDYTPASGETLTIKSVVPSTQTTTLPLGGALPSSSIEERLDKNVRLIQQREEELDRSVKLEETSAFSGITIPDPVAGEYLQWKQDLSGFQNTSLFGIEGGVVFNESGGAVDFRIESDTLPSLFHLDGTNNRIGIGAAPTDGLVHIQSASAGVIAAPTDGDLVLESDGSVFMSFLGSDAGFQGFYFGSATSGNDAGRLLFQPSSDTWFLQAGNGVTILQSSNSACTINEGAVDLDFRVESVNSAYAFMVDASTDRVGFSNASLAPTDGLVHIQSGNAGAVTAAADADDLVLEGSGNTGLSIAFPVANKGTLSFTSPTQGDDGSIEYNQATRIMTIDAYNAQNHLELGGNVGAVFNQDGVATFDFRVEGDTSTHLLFCDASENRAGVSLSGNLVTDGLFHIASATAGAVTANTLGDQLVIEGGAESVGLSILHTNVGGEADILFGHETDNDYVRIRGASSEFQLYVGSTDPIIKARSTFGTVFNDNGIATHDFRVESDTSTHALFVDAGNNRVGISNTSVAPTDGLLHIQSASAGVVDANTLADDLVIENSGDAGLSILTPQANIGRVLFGSPTSNVNGIITFAHSEDAFYFNNDNGVSSSEFLNMKRASGAVFNEGGVAAQDFRVESDLNTHMFFVDAGNNSVHIDNSLTTGAGDGELVMANDKSIRWVNPGGTSSAANGIRVDANGDLRFETELAADAFLFNQGSSNEFIMRVQNGGMGLTFVNESSTDHAAPGADEAVLYTKDNGAGKTQLCVRFNTGAVQVLATEP